MAHHHTAVVLERMHLETDPLLTIPLKGNNVEGMQRRRRRAGINACLYLIAENPSPDREHDSSLTSMSLLVKASVGVGPY